MNTLKSVSKNRDMPRLFSRLDEVFCFEHRKFKVSKKLGYPPKCFRVCPVCLEDIDERAFC